MNSDPQPASRGRGRKRRGRGGRGRGRGATQAGNASASGADRDVGSSYARRGGRVSEDSQSRTVATAANRASNSAALVSSQNNSRGRAPMPAQASTAPMAPTAMAPAQNRRRRRGKADAPAWRAAPPLADPEEQGDAAGITELSARLTALMERGRVECVVCLDRIRRDKAIWSCSTCWCIIHLYCAKKWARQAGNDADDDEQQQSISDFRCPSCRAPAGDPFTLQFSCYCGRQRNPQLEPGVTPGSCGEPCLRSRGAPLSGCPHRCSLLCHAGPCDPCNAIAAPVSCHCGKELVERRCGEARLPDGVSCGLPCGRIKEACGHACERLCHADACGECLTAVDVTCFCNLSTTKLPCALAVDGFGCGSTCRKKLVCGNHFCQEKCHDGECGVCPTSPTALTTCACGKRQLSTEEMNSRTSCQDPIPSCGMPCGGSLGCLGNHKCDAICGHSGDCEGCDAVVEADCRCGASTISVTCGEPKEVLYKKLVCNRRCNDRLACKQHNCESICCPFRKRKALLRKGVVSSEKLWKESPEVVIVAGDAESATTNAEWRRRGHACEKRCEKTLACGQHACDLACGHFSDCPPCGILVREDLYCTCGASHIPGPVRCGTSPPSCERPCQNVRPCGHFCREKCHSSDCPLCVELVRLDCVGGHGESRYIACHIGAKGIACHRSCGRGLRCGVHACRKGCHGGVPEECEVSAEDGCTQPCGLPRQGCGHACSYPCHPDMRCPDTPCQASIKVTCPCGRREEDAPCLRGGRGTVIGSNGVIRLICDDECASQYRLRAFASVVGKGNALSLNPRGASASSAAGACGTQTGAGLNDVGGGITTYSGFLMQFAENEPAVLGCFERDLASIVLGKVRKVELVGLPQLHRLVVHTLAELYSLDSESEGRHSNRRVVIRHRGAGVKPAFPFPLLSEAYIRQEQEKRDSRRAVFARSLILHVASSGRAHPASADVVARVERELRAHKGSYKILRKETMSSNLEGVLVQFSTPERTESVRASLANRSGVTIQVGDGRDTKTEKVTEPDTGVSPVWIEDEGTPGNSGGLRAGASSSIVASRYSSLSTGHASTVTVPDSWDADE